MLRIGMLWYGDKKKTLAENVAVACAFYREKYGDSPDVAYVNPQDVDASTPLVRIVPNKTILRQHVWVGVTDNDEPLKKVSA